MKAFEKGSGKYEIQLFTTMKCNLACSYCVHNDGDVVGSQGKVSYSMDQLSDFLDNNLPAGAERYFTFFGGEPSLNPKFIGEVMERWPESRFQMQTNATLLTRLPDSLLKNLDNILASIDGGQRTTDKYRGMGVFKRVMTNVEHARSRIRGTMTARVTWCDEDTTFEELDGLLVDFDYLYWQFAEFAAGYGEAGMAKKRAVLTRLAAKFHETARMGKLYPMVPMMGVARNVLRPDLADSETFGQTQCRASTNLINITPEGKVYPCPDLTYDDALLQGSVKEGWLKAPTLLATDKMPCEKCEAFSWCRRNCLRNLYLAYEKGDEELRTGIVEPVCALLRFLGSELIAGGLQEAFDSLEPVERDRLLNNALYDYVEVMP